jgi:hypothetical protein
MNERIKELAKQAGFMVDQGGHIMVCFTSDGNDEVKKFAELIVRECIQLALKNDDPLMAQDISEHFGI